jgi:hypothetical protein
MRVARVIFGLAGIWGLAALIPFYFGYQLTGEPAPPLTGQPEYLYGFLGVAVAWQIAFLVIASDPIRFRALMPVAMVEKFLPAVSIAVLYGKGQIAAGNPFLAGTVADVVLGLLFIWAFVAAGGAKREKS